MISGNNQCRNLKFIFFFQVFITKSYDATSHFETTCTDVLKVFQAAYGGPFDYDKVQNVDQDLCS